MALAEDRPTGRKKPNLPESPYLKYSSLGIQLLATLFISGWLGWKIDQYLSLKFPFFSLIMGFMAFFGYMYKLYKSISD